MNTVWSAPTDLFISSMTGYGISVSTPVLEISVGYNYLNMTLTNAKTNRKVMLKGTGGGIGAGLGLFPASGNLSDDSHTTLNNRIYTFAGNAFSEADLEGDIDVWSGGGVLGTHKQAGMVVYFLASDYLGRCGLATKAAAIVYGEGRVTDFAQAGLECTRFSLKFV